MVSPRNWNRYALTGWIVVFTAATAVANWTSYHNNHQLAHDEAVGDARACVAAWEGRQQVRDTIQTVADTLLTAAEADPNDPRVIRFRELVAGDVTAIENPACDIKAARRTLENE